MTFVFFKRVPEHKTYVNTALTFQLSSLNLLILSPNSPLPSPVIILTTCLLLTWRSIPTLKSTIRICESVARPLRPSHANRK
jgi:hypothetical protein